MTRPMTWLKVSILTGFFIFSLFSSAHAQIVTSVPFENIVLASNHTIQASYSFGSHAEIFCFSSDSTPNIDRINWTYRGQTQTSTLPILLKVNPIYTGSFADANGTILITNTLGSSQSMSCVFGF